jgi:hypothetical protein
MYLWNDYEGQQLAGFPLEKLLRTEGRSAFFSTRDRSGEPAMIRLTEALNDQDQLRARYGAVQAAGKEHLVGIEAFGEAEMDGQPLFYLVMEPTQESLSDIIATRRLSIEETNDVATAVVSAVEALHAKGLTHGQVEPVSVLAAGEVIKLRSDCVRQAPEGSDGARAYAADVLGVAGVLSQSLTQAPLVDASDALALPEPYASIVRNVFRGSWGIEQVGTELRRFVRPPVVRPAAQPVRPHVQPAPPAAQTLPPATTAATASVGRSAVPGAVPAEADSAGQPEVRKAPSAAVGARSMGETLVAAERLADKPGAGARREEPRPISSRAGIAPSGPLAPLPSNGKGHGEAQLPLAYDRTDTTGEADKTGQSSREREGSRVGESSWRRPGGAAGIGSEEESVSLASRPVVWVAGGVMVLLLFLLWHMMGSKSAPAKPQAAASTPAGASSSTQAGADASRSMAGAAAGPNSAAPAPAPAPTDNAATSAPAAAASGAELTATGGKVWRVVAYTYNSKAQAEAQAKDIKARHPDVRPEAFTANGHAPYLVTLGGPMTREQAIALRARARKEGLAHGAYIQNYTH